MFFSSALVPSIQKCLIDAEISSLAKLPSQMTALRGQIFSFQLAFRGGEKPEGAGWHRALSTLTVKGIPEKNLKMRRVCHVPSLMPAYEAPRYDDGYLATKACFLPDLLNPMPVKGRLPIVYGQTHAVWFDIEGAAPGSYDIEITLSYEEFSETHSFSLEVLHTALPEQEMRVTQWLHCDCLATYYDCEVFSERHWKIIENFVRVAVRNGINLILTPIFTPPLDTYIGGERPTVQLVDVYLYNGKYSFGFEKLDRWIEMCNRCGVKYFEISHLFTQWGAAHAPKIIANVDGEMKKIFGWETDASEGDYPEFLSVFLPAFIDHMKQRGDDKRCHYHVSDEPSAEQIEQYLKSKSVVSEYLKDYDIMDALSDYDFYEQGVLKVPIPANNHIEPFIENKVQNLWTYYCCGQNMNVSNRFLAMNGSRTRAICAAFYKYDIVGFLQWGYNFYYNQGSYGFNNPYLDTTGDYWVPSGDAFSVYPSHDGKALETIRICNFREALEDVRAMKLLESLTDKDTVLGIIESVLGNVSFDVSNYAPEKILEMRAAIDNRIDELTK
jgi:hypothetical protein